jgi:transcriptional regulator with XRE-family HTH domain
MTKRKERMFGQVIRERRRQLDLTQQEVAKRIKTSTPYVGHLEAGKRHPSDRILVRLADVLGLDQRELFFLANPRTVDMLRPHTDDAHRSAWEEFRKDDRLKRIHGITGEEMDMLSKVALMGQISSTRDFIYILNTVRHALGR